MIRHFILITAAIMIAVSPMAAQKKNDAKKQDTSTTVTDVVDVPNLNKYLVTGEGHRSDIYGLEGMDLTEEQLRKISDLRALSQKNEQKIREALRQALQSNRDQLINDISKVLTPEQAKVYKEKQALYKERHQSTLNKDSRRGHNRHHHKNHHRRDYDRGHGCCR